MQQDESFSEIESITLIESMIHKAKNQFSENGHLYLVWGWVILICSLSQFLFSMVHYERGYYVWFLTWIVVIYQWFYLAKKKKRRKVRTYTDEIIGFVWLAFMITIFLFAYIIGRGQGFDYYRIVYPGFLALYAIPTFLSGAILRFKPLMAGGGCCWILCVLATFIPSQYQLLLVAAAMILAWIVPGYLLQARFKKTNA